MTATPLDSGKVAFDRIAQVRILVIGDIMLDVDRVGEATRISPEAPVPVLLNPRTEYRLGGAGAVAAMCAALGARVILIGVLGQDSSGIAVRTIVGSASVHLQAAIDPFRPTTTKERICGVSGGRHRQQLGRLDAECTDCISGDTETLICDTITDQLAALPDVIIVSDYGKGVCTEEVISRVRTSGLPVIVDPPKNSNWISDYFGVTCVVPNRYESDGCTASQLRPHVYADAVIVKLDEDGCDVAVRDPASNADISITAKIPSRARAVHDVTSAGDQFIATLACARAAGMDWIAAAELANQAAGLQVERHGCQPVTAQELELVNS